jgi:phospholipid/cholesterol/gamma-HCH transport system substrate-binding protein
MAERSKVRWSQLKAGLVALAALAVAAVFIFLLTSKKGLFVPYATLKTYVSDASGLPDGTPVRLNGITVGFLDKLRLTGLPDPRRAVELELQVQEKYLDQIPVDSLTQIASANLLGDQFIDIKKGKLPQHVRSGDELASAVSPQDIPELMAGMSNLMTSFQMIVGRMNNLIAGVEQGKGTLGKFFNDPALFNQSVDVVAEAQQLLTDVRKGGGTLSKLIYDPGLYNDLQSPIKRVDALLADLQAGKGTAGKFMSDPALYDQATSIADQIKQILADLQAGKGTAGELLKNDQLSKRLDGLITKLDTTVDKLNAGQGTAGQFLDNPQLYQAMTGATREFQDLAKDIRKNPKEFLSIRLKLF